VDNFIEQWVLGDRECRPQLLNEAGYHEYFSAVIQDSS
jgi:hypothetical protein